MEFKLHAVVLDCKNALELANFYKNLLGWDYKYNHEDWIQMESPNGTTSLAFQTEEWYEKPRRRDADNTEKQMHLDFEVTNLKEAVEHALVCGAESAPSQPYKNVHIMLDPSGHPFCLFAH